MPVHEWIQGFWPDNFQKNLEKKLEKTHRFMEICLHDDESTSHVVSKKKKISQNDIRLLESQKNS